MTELEAATTAPDPDPPRLKKWTWEKNYSRDLRIRKMFLEGFTLQQIGEVFDLTKQRINQIIHSFSLTHNDGGVAVRARQRKKERLASRDQRYLDKWGHTFVEHKHLLRVEGVARHDTYRTPIASYRTHKYNRLKSHHTWSLRLSDWWQCWQDSGKWKERGRGKGKYVLTRLDPTKPFEVGNITIMKFEDAVLQRTPRTPSRDDY